MNPLETLTRLEQEVERQAKIILALERLTKENEVYKKALEFIVLAESYSQEEQPKVPKTKVVQTMGSLANTALAEGLRIRRGDDK